VLGQQEVAADVDRHDPVPLPDQTSTASVPTGPAHPKDNVDTAEEVDGAGHAYDLVLDGDVSLDESDRVAVVPAILGGSPPSGLRSTMTTRAPSAVMASTHARPIPDAPPHASGTNWGRSRGQRLSVGGVGELGVPAVEVVGELVVEDTGADLQQQVGAAG